MNSLTEENYLKTLFTLAGESGEVNVNELSKRLGIKMPTVTSMMKALSKKNLVFYEKYKPLRLTAKGKKEALLILRKHRLTEMYLVQIMGFGWEEVHKIAEQVEHITASELFEKMDKMLNHPKIDPHGSPIPDKNGKMEWLQYNKLSECKPGDSVKIAAVTEAGDDFLRFLNSRNLRLGLKLKIKSVESFDGSMSIDYDDKKNKMFSHTVCERLLVEKIK
jgi:DtxR family Mn-dependent transcriptional regulator